MPKSEVAVVDYGVGNLLSVRRGLEQCGATVTVTSDPQVILAAPQVVLPGVGAFANGMEQLRNRDLEGVVREVADRGTPVLAICLGMQLLLDSSEEFGASSGLGLIPGRVLAVPATTAEGAPQKIPHIGWNVLALPEGRETWAGTVLEGIGPDEAVYFVHSFMAMPLHDEHRLADCLYGGQRVTAAVSRDNVFGCQFHPEKSGAVGLKVLDRFLAR